jgi:pilus assembly protein CpaC
MTSRKNIRTVYNPKQQVLSVTPDLRDVSTIILSGRRAGLTRLELVDVDGNREIVNIAVEIDVEYLYAQLRKALPTVGINIIPNGENSLILTGYVSRAEDIQLAEAIVRTAYVRLSDIDPELLPGAGQPGAGTPGTTRNTVQIINGLRLNGVQQVQLDVVVARVNRSKIRSFGFNFLQNSRRQIAGSSIGGILANPQGVQLGAGGAGGGGGQGVGILGPTQAGQALSATAGNANLFGGIISNNAGFLAFLQALETQGVAKLMSQPRLVTLSGNPASILDGGEQAVPQVGGIGGVAGVEFQPFGTTLQFLPIVLGNGRIHLEVEPEVSSLNNASGVLVPNGGFVPGRSTQRVRTTVEMETGQTFVLGGLIQKTKATTIDRLPVLGQIPFLGAAFSAKNDAEEETELVVLVTPHLVDAQSACQVVKVLPGQESRSPDDCELFLEGLLEAPRGPRSMFVNGRYIPAHHTGPTADLFPCAGKADGIYSVPHSSFLHGARGGLHQPCASGTGACTPGTAGNPTLPTGTPVGTAEAAKAPETTTTPAPPASLPPGPTGEALPLSGTIPAETPMDSTNLGAGRIVLPPISPKADGEN